MTAIEMLEEMGYNNILYDITSIPRYFKCGSVKYKGSISPATGTEYFGHYDTLSELINVLYSRAKELYPDKYWSY